MSSLGLGLGIYLPRLCGMATVHLAGRCGGALLRVQAVRRASAPLLRGAEGLSHVDQG